MTYKMSIKSKKAKVAKLIKNKIIRQHIHKIKGCRVCHQKYKAWKGVKI